MDEPSKVEIDKVRPDMLWLNGVKQGLILITNNYENNSESFRRHFEN